MGAAARDILVRDAVEADLPAIRDIYNHAVRETFAIWSDHETTTLARAAWMSARRQAGFPVLAAAWASNSRAS
jgi:L-amino acid N-acyltransferase